MSSEKVSDTLFGVAASTQASSMDDALALQASQAAALVAILLPAAEQAIVYLASNASELVNSTLTRLPEVADKTVSPLISQVRDQAHALIWGLLSDLLRPVLCILIVAQVLSTLITLCLLEFGGKVLAKCHVWGSRPADAKHDTVQLGVPVAAGQGGGRGGRGADLLVDAIPCDTREPESALSFASTPERPKTSYGRSYSSDFDELTLAQPATICLGPEYAAEAAAFEQPMRHAAGASCDTSSACSLQSCSVSPHAHNAQGRAANRHAAPAVSCPRRLQPPPPAPACLDAFQAHQDPAQGAPQELTPNPLVTSHLGPSAQPSTPCDSSAVAEAPIWGPGDIRKVFLMMRQTNSAESTPASPKIGVLTVGPPTSSTTTSTTVSRLASTKSTTVSRLALALPALGVFNGPNPQEIASETRQGAGVSASGAGAEETAKRLSWGSEQSRGVVQALRAMSSASASKLTSSLHRRSMSSPGLHLTPAPDSEGLNLLLHASTQSDMLPTCESGGDSGEWPHDWFEVAQEKARAHDAFSQPAVEQPGNGSGKVGVEGYEAQHGRRTRVDKLKWQHGHHRSYSDGCSPLQRDVCGLGAGGS